LRRWGLIGFLLLLAAALQFRLWWGDGGLGEARELQERVGAQQQENARLQQRNDALEAEVEDLKSGEAAVEDRARSELGMVKPGEVFYRVVDPDAGSAGPAGAAEAATSGTDTAAAAEPGR
jgi:cell division protein FtsB